jgi:hypothetical protein
LAQQHGATITRYNGALVVASKQHNAQFSVDQGWLAFLDNSLALAGDAQTVRAAITRHRAGGLGPSPKLVGKVNDVSSRYDFWAVSMMPVSEWAGKVPDENVSGLMKGDALRGILETSGGMKLGTEIEFSGEAVTRSEKDATALADVVRFMIGVVQLNVKDPKAQEAIKYLQAMNLETQGNVMRVSLKIPQAEIEKAILAAKAQQKTAIGSQRGLRRERITLRAPEPPSGDITIHSSPRDMGTVTIKQQ